MRRVGRREEGVMSYLTIINTVLGRPESLLHGEDVAHLFSAAGRKLPPDLRLDCFYIGVLNPALLTIG